MSTIVTGQTPSSPPGTAKAPPATIVVFGAAGDLAKRLLVPSLYNLADAGLLDDGVEVLGLDIADTDDAGWKTTLGTTIQSFVHDPDAEFHPSAINAGAWDWLMARAHYQRADFTQEASFAALKQRIGDRSALFYLAVPARFFGPIVDHLGAAGLFSAPDGAFRHLVIEKPFGSDLASARALNARILAQAREDQIFRIDHFMGKEPVQSILAMRFANVMFEPLWRAQYVDRVEITAAETIGVEARGRFYEPTGVVRDMVPNHLFQLLTMVAMDAPSSLDAEAVRTEKTRLLRAIRPLGPDDVVFGQYGAGTADGHAVAGYREEPDVAADSTTPTYVAARLHIENWRWAGTPFLLRTGKRMAGRRTEIVVHLKAAPFALFPGVPRGGGDLGPDRAVDRSAPRRRDRVRREAAGTRDGARQGDQPLRRRRGVRGAPERRLRGLDLRLPDGRCDAVPAGRCHRGELGDRRPGAHRARQRAGALRRWSRGAGRRRGAVAEGLARARQRRIAGMTRLIEDYALIGDCHTAALVGRDGSMDWLCLPRFDSPAVFAALLGDDGNGRWRIAAVGDGVTVTRRYRPDTLILETRFETADGAATLIDFMPVRDGIANIVRLVVGERGSLDFELDLVMRFDYGRSVPWVTRLDDRTITAVAGPSLLVLHASTPLEGKDMHTQARFTTRPGETQRFVLTHEASHLPVPKPCDADVALAETEEFWTEYCNRCPGVGDYKELVKRSLITLKALTYRPTGGIVAAATTSLPEAIGGSRNWDYRYCWLRDATLTLIAFMELGYYDEAHSWREWLMRSIAGDPGQIQIMYGVAGERQLLEWEIPWLAGFRDSKPVRVGNGAAGQLQLDVYGEVADMMAQARRKLPPHPRAEAISLTVLGFLQTAWRQPDEGIWEVRGGPKHHVHSKVMAWVAFDRAATLAAETGGGHHHLATRWRTTADEIHADVCANGFDTGLGSFVQSYGATALDASLLLIPSTGFLPVDDPRVAGTIAAIETRLMHQGFVRRYDTGATDDGLSGSEGVFLACSFWLADVYVLQGRIEDATRLFERLAGLCNDVGLLAEEYDPTDGILLGNFPQAFSHLGLIATALNLSRARGPAQQRATGPDEAAPVSTDETR